MSKQWYDTIGIIGGNLFVLCVLLALAYVIFEIVTGGRADGYDIEEAELEYKERKRPKPEAREEDDKLFFDKVEEARNDFN